VAFGCVLHISSKFLTGSLTRNAINLLSLPIVLLLVGSYSFSGHFDILMGDSQSQLELEKFLLVLFSFVDDLLLFTAI
jgi:hypothetical protein